VGIVGLDLLITTVITAIKIRTHLENLKRNQMSNWTEELTDKQKQEVWDFIVFTVKEIREQIAVDILATSDLWSAKGLSKSRRTQKAFKISAAIARGQNEIDAK
jgi:hypothetical protein